MEEIWKDIKEFEGLYQISNRGNVRSLDRTDNNNHFKEGHLLPLCDNGKGYKIVGLWKNNEQCMKQVHRLVAEAFIPNTNNLPCVNHKDENPSNNDVTNLEWCTYEYNNNYGTKGKRISDANSKSVIQYTKQGEFVAEYKSAIEAKENTGIDNGHIGKCCNGQRKSAGGFLWEYKIKIKSNNNE